MGNTTVNWEKYESRNARKSGNRTERFYEVTCGICGLTYGLRKHDARKAVAENRTCKKCQTSAAGKRGYKVTAAKLGNDFALQAVIKTQLANPSKPEQQIAVWLDELGVSYTRQVIVNLATSRYIVDFMLADGRGIEGAGGYYHARNKQSKDEQLAEMMIVLFLTDDLVMKNPDAAFGIIKKFVSQG